MAEAGYEEYAACLRFDNELEDYLEGEERPFVTVHARECRSCSALLADLEMIRRTARELPGEEPSPVIWANLRARLEAEGVIRPQVSAWQKLLAWRFLAHPAPACALAGLLILGSLVSIPPTRNDRWNGPEVTAPSTAPVAASAISLSEDSSLARLVDDLESSYRANEATLAPDLKATYEKSLVSLNGSIRECLDSLQHEPRNSLAHEYLLTAYTRKAEILSSALEFEGR